MHIYNNKKIIQQNDYLLSLWPRARRAAGRLPQAVTVEGETSCAICLSCRKAWRKQSTRRLDLDYKTFTVPQTLLSSFPSLLPFFCLNEQMSSSLNNVFFSRERSLRNKRVSGTSQTIILTKSWLIVFFRKKERKCKKRFSPPLLSSERAQLMIHIVGVVLLEHLMAGQCQWQLWLMSKCWMVQNLHYNWLL